MATNQIKQDDIVWLKCTAPIADGNGRYWLVVDVRDKYIEIASLSTGKRHGTTMDDVQEVFHPVWKVDTHITLLNFSRPVDAHKIDQENEIAEENQLQPRERKILNLLAKERKGITRDDIARRLMIELPIVYEICHRLGKQKYLSSKAGFYNLTLDGKKAIEE